MLKYFILFFTLSIVGLISTAATSGFHTSEDVVKKLSLYNLPVGSFSKGTSLLSDQQLDDMYSDLELANQFATKNEPNEDAVYEMERVTLLIYQRDPELYSTFILLPAYRDHKKTFEQAAARLHPTDRQRILQSLNDAEKFYNEGEGKE